MAKLSLITAIHNALPMNQLYWQALSENTTSPFELIIIDNHSTDGSEKFFSELSQKTRGTNKEVIYVRNEKNFWYSHSQNQGMALARYDILGFLNNDIWMCKGWNEPFEKAFEKNPLYVMSPSGQEAQPRQKLSDRLKRKSKLAMFRSRLWQIATGKSETERLWKALQYMYGDLNNFKSPTPQAEPAFFHGLKGDAVLFHRKLLKKIPNPWDETVNAPDWHLYLTVAKLHEAGAFIPLPRILTNSYVHHFGRYSTHLKYEPYDLKTPLIPLEQLWEPSLRDKLWWGNHLPA